MRDGLKIQSEIAACVIHILEREGYSLHPVPGDPEKKSALFTVFPPGFSRKDDPFFMIEIWEAGVSEID